MPAISLILTIDAPEFALSQAIEATTFHVVHKLHSLNFIVNLYTVPTTDVSLKIILKMSGQKRRIFFNGYLLILLRIKPSTCKKIFIVPTIGLLLEMHSSMCTLHTFLSSVQILKIHFEPAERCFLEYINIQQRSAHSKGRDSTQLLNIYCKE